MPEAGKEGGGFCHHRWMAAMQAFVWFAHQPARRVAVDVAPLGGEISPGRQAGRVGHLRTAAVYQPAPPSQPTAAQELQAGADKQLPRPVAPKQQFQGTASR